MTHVLEEHAFFGPKRKEIEQKLSTVQKNRTQQIQKAIQDGEDSQAMTQVWRNASVAWSHGVPFGFVLACLPPILDVHVQLVIKKSVYEFISATMFTWNFLSSRVLLR